MMDKKVTRKEFLLSIASVAAIFVASKVPSMVKNSLIPTKKNNNAYGNYSYGGNKKNV